MFLYFFLLTYNKFWIMIECISIIFPRVLIEPVLWFQLIANVCMTLNIIVGTLKQNDFLYLLHCPASQGSHISIILGNQLVLNWFFLSFCGIDYGLTGLNYVFMQKHFLEIGIFLVCRLILSFVMVDLLILGRDMSSSLHIQIRMIINLLKVHLTNGFHVITIICFQMNLNVSFYFCQFWSFCLLVTESHQELVPWFFLVQYKLICLV